MYIVLEYYLLENFIINFLILYMTNIITKSDTSVKNIILVSIFCSLYSLVPFSPRLLFLTRPYMKVIISLFIIRFTFGIRNIRTFIYQLMGFYIISFVFAGAIMGISFNHRNITKMLFEESRVIDIFKFKYIIIGLMTAIIISYRIFKHYHEKNIQESYIVDVEIGYRGKKVSIKALVDTGHSLVEPFTNRPVFIAEFQGIESILPNSVREFYMKENTDKEFYQLEELLGSLDSSIGIRLIPFRSIGSENGILLGFKPEYLMISMPNRNQVLKRDMIVGIYKGRLSSDLNYRGLLHYNTIYQEDEA